MPKYCSSNNNQKACKFLITTALCSTLFIVTGNNAVFAQNVEIVGDVTPVIPQVTPGVWVTQDQVSVGGSTTNGTLTIKDGADVTLGGLSANGSYTLDPQIYVRDSRFVISGPNTIVRLENGNSNYSANLLYVTSSTGLGSLIENGATLTAETVRVRGWTRYNELDTTSTHLTITGANTRLQSQNNIDIDDGGKVLVADGASVIGTSTEIRGNSDNGLVGQVYVTGKDSVWSVTGQIQVGIDSTGVLLIDKGGTINSGSAVIGDLYKPYGPYVSGSYAAVSGIGSRWDIQHHLQIGSEDGSDSLIDGRLFIDNGGVLTSQSVVVSGNYTASASSIFVGGGDGNPAEKAGHLYAETLNLKDQYARLVLNHTNSDLAFDQAQETDALSTMAISGNGSIVAISGRTIFNHDQLGFEGKIVIDGLTGFPEEVLNTTLQFNGDISNAAETIINAGGAMEGIGKVGTLTNSGILAPGKSLSANHGSDATGIGAFTVKGDYISNNGLILIDTVLGDDSSQTDKLVVNGSTSGDGTVRVTNVGGIGAQTNDGIKIIEIGDASNAKFTLDGDYEHEGEQAVVAGAYAYKLHKGSSNATDGDWYLRSKLKPKDLIIDPPVDPEGPDPIIDPLYNAGAPIYEVYPQFLLGLNALPTMQQRVGNRYWNNAGNRIVAQGADVVEVFASATEAGSFTQSNGVWGRIEGAHNKSEPRFSTSASTYDFNSFKMQAGLDGQLTETENGKLIGGVTVHYTHGKANIASVHGNGDIKTDGYGFGGTLSWYGKNGFYVDGQGQLTWYRSELNTSTGKKDLADGKNNGFGYALSVEAGQRITIDDQWSVTSQAQLQYSNVDFDDFTTKWGKGGRSDVSLDKGDSLIGRLGVSLDYQNSWQNTQGMTDRSVVYGVVNLYNEFLDGTKVDVNRTRFINKSERFWGGIGLGGSYNWNDDKYSIYGEGSINTSFKNFGDSYNYKGTVGLRVKW